MFELITISNGLAVVQHAPTGNVYRFRPMHPGLWHALVLERVEASDADEAARGGLAVAALAFAEHAMSSVWEGADAQLPLPPMPASRRIPFGWRPRRRPALS